jgi:uncharacterized repeat protein (TIGR03803 family)
MQLQRAIAARTGLARAGKLLLLVSTMLVLLPSTAGAQSAPVYSTVAVFQPGDPANPLSILVQARDGNLYGTSTLGGTHGRGTVFRLTPDGTVTIMHSFAGPDGCMGPLASLIDEFNNGLTLGTDGNLYGIAVCSQAAGVFFKMATDGTFTVLHAFKLNQDGAARPGAPVEGPDGNFYAFSSKDDFGDLYRMSPTGVLTTLYAFKTSGDPNLFNPERLWLGSDGNLYGYSSGHQAGVGALFKASLQGDVSVVHNFNPPEPMAIDAPLDESNDGNWYGASYHGAAINGFGNIFKLSPAGDPTTLFTFHETDGLGRLPSTALIQATDGNLYGGASGPQVLFRVTTGGTYTVVHRFSVKQDVLAGPASGFVQHTNGILYATTYESGSSKCAGGCGGAYSLNIGAGPFVRFLLAQSNATPGHTVGLLGQGLSGTQGVAFNGMPAQVSLISDTYLETTIPDKATSGPITVTLGGGVTLTSNKIFHVVPPPPPLSPASVNTDTAPGTARPPDAAAAADTVDAAPTAMPDDGAQLDLAAPPAA